MVSIFEVKKAEKQQAVVREQVLKEEERDMLVVSGLFLVENSSVVEVQFAILSLRY